MKSPYRHFGRSPGPAMCNLRRSFRSNHRWLIVRLFGYRLILGNLNELKKEDEELDLFYDGSW